MKTFRIAVVAMVLFTATVVKAQVSVDIHYGPPAWAPAAPATVQYYYLPDIGAYYDVPAQRYIYLRKGAWVREAQLPPRYRSYDLYHSRPVYLVDYRGNTPYAEYKVHKVKYKGKAHGKGWKHGHRR